MFPNSSDQGIPQPPWQNISNIHNNLLNDLCVIAVVPVLKAETLEFTVSLSLRARTILFLL